MERELECRCNPSRESRSSVSGATKVRKEISFLEVVDAGDFNSAGEEISLLSGRDSNLSTVDAR